MVSEQEADNSSSLEYNTQEEGMEVIGSRRTYKCIVINNQTEIVEINTDSDSESVIVIYPK